VTSSRYAMHLRAAFAAAAPPPQRSCRHGGTWPR
jgi:hypothetical protein